MGYINSSKRWLSSSSFHSGGEDLRVDSQSLSIDPVARNRWNNPFLALIVVVIGLLLRSILLVSHWGQDPMFLQYSDSYGYLRLSHNLLVGNGYSWDIQPPFAPNVYRPPGMPLLIWGIFKGFGEHLEGVILLQIMVSCLTIWFIYRLGTVLSGRFLGLASAFLLAIDPVSIVFSNLMLTEIFSAFFLATAFLCAAIYIQSGRLSYLIWIGIIFSIGISFHPIILFLPLFLLLLPFVNGNLRKCRRDLLFSLIAFLIALAPAMTWTIRNKIISDYTGISCVAAVNMLKYKAAGVLSIVNHTSREQERDRLTAECEKMLPPKATDGQRWRLWESVGRQIIFKHPLIYLKMHVTSMGYEILSPGRDYLSRFLYHSTWLTDKDGVVRDSMLYRTDSEDRSFWRPLVQKGALLFHFSTLLLSAIGAFLLILKKRWGLLFGLSIPILYILSLTAGPEAESRFRVIYEPFLCLFAGLALNFLLNPPAPSGERTSNHENRPVSGVHHTLFPH